MRSKWIDFKSPLANGIRAFIAYKRSLGRKYHTEEKNLRLLDRYLVEQKIIHTNNITPDILDSFLASRPRKRTRSYNDLVGILKRFFDWLVVQQIINSSPLKVHRKRETDNQIPYIFDLGQVRQLLAIASGLADSSSAPMRGATYQMIFALLYGLGLRVGEVSRLHRKDIDLNRDLLIIRHTKFSKSRLVPFGPRMSARLHKYIRQRENRFGKLAPDDPVFSFHKNKAIRPATISQAFHYFILPMLDIHVPPGVRPPRLHDLRHSFAVRTLLCWYRSGINPPSRLFHLSTFLGHVSPVSTAVYLTITDELLAEASSKFEHFAFHPLQEKRA
jgi:site-specific recombinase XerD